MNIKRLIIPCVLLLSIILAGCNTTTGDDAPYIRNYQQDTVSNAHPRARLVLGSRNLVDEIVMVDVRMGSAGQLQRAEVSVQNLSNDRYTLEYMVAWEDRQGFSINENRVWKRFVLGPREIRSFQTTGSSPEAYALTMTVRLPDDIFIHQERTEKRK
jgi:uncharacterized protein YcfL